MSRSVGSVFIAANSYTHTASAGLEVLHLADKAIEDYVRLFYSLRFDVRAHWNDTAEELRENLREFLDTFKKGGQAAGKYAVFVFVGHGGENDVLYAEDGNTISTEEIVKSFTTELPENVLKMFFIDSCRGDGVVSGVPYSPDQQNCLLARSTLPYQEAWTQTNYGELYAPKLSLIMD